MISVRAEDVDIADEYFDLGGRLVDREKILYASYQRRYFIFSLLLLIEVSLLITFVKYGVHVVGVAIFIFLLFGTYREWRRRAIVVLNVLDMGPIQIYGLNDLEAQYVVSKLNEANLWQ